MFHKCCHISGVEINEDGLWVTLVLWSVQLIQSWIPNPLGYVGKDHPTLCAQKQVQVMVWSCTGTLGVVNFLIWLMLNSIHMFCTNILYEHQTMCCIFQGRSCSFQQNIAKPDSPDVINLAYYLKKQTKYKPKIKNIKMVNWPVYNPKGFIMK